MTAAAAIHSQPSITIPAEPVAHVGHGGTALSRPTFLMFLPINARFSLDGGGRSWRVVGPAAGGAVAVESFGLAMEMSGLTGVVRG